MSQTIKKLILVVLSLLLLTVSVVLGNNPASAQPISTTASPVVTIGCTTSAQNKVTKDVTKVLTKYRYTAIAKKAILYRMCRESNLNPKYKNGVSIGLLSWSFTRATSLRTYAKSIGKPVWSVDAQVGYMDKEMKAYTNPLSFKGTYKAVLNKTGSAQVMCQFVGALPCF